MYYFICEGAYFVFYSEEEPGVTLQNRREQVTAMAKQFWTLCTLLI